MRDLGGVREKSALWVLRLMSESCEKLELVLPVGEKEENTQINVTQQTEALTYTQQKWTKGGD